MQDHQDADGEERKLEERPRVTPAQEFAEDGDPQKIEGRRLRGGRGRVG
jgi:hypothetical protein